TAARAASTGTWLFRDHVLKGGPRDDRKHGVVESEKAQVPTRMCRHARSDTADDDRYGERQEQEGQEKLTRPSGDGHGGENGADRADAQIGEEDASDGRSVDPGEEEREGRQRDKLGDDEETEHGDRLREPDRAAIAGSEQEAVDQALLALGDERTRQAEQRREDDRDPEQTLRSKLGAVGRERKVEDDERCDDEDQHRRNGVARPELQSEVLAGEHQHVGEV